jgi:plasmid stabilization system protein ParE
MIRQTLSAERQARALFRHYIEKDRPAAHRNLAAAIRIAARRIASAPHDGAPFPHPYPGMARWEFRWIKVHRYWFAWSTAKGYPVLTNILHDESDMPRRIAPDEPDDIPV